MTGIYVGAGVVLAEPMTLREYERRRLKKTGKQRALRDEPGYVVLIGDTWRGWISKTSFERAYRKMTLVEKTLIEGEDG